MRVAIADYGAGNLRSLSSALARAGVQPIVTTDPLSHISFFAGPTDDPFFFDIPAFNRFRSTGDPAQFSRGRDSFAGYNTMSIALSIPQSFFTVKATNRMIGIAARTLRASTRRCGRSSPRWWKVEPVIHM